MRITLTTASGLLLLFFKFKKLYNNLQDQNLRPIALSAHTTALLKKNNIQTNNMLTMEISSFYFTRLQIGEVASQKHTIKKCTYKAKIEMQS